MKTKIFAYLFIAVIYLFPFRYAILDPTPSFTVNLLCMIAVVFGTLIFMGLMITDGEKHVKTQAVGKDATIHNDRKQAA